MSRLLASVGSKKVSWKQIQASWQKQICKSNFIHCKLCLTVLQYKHISLLLVLIIAYRI